jgi:hypothetical protein
MSPDETLCPMTLRLCRAPASWMLVFCTRSAGHRPSPCTAQIEEGTLLWDAERVTLTLPTGEVVGLSGPEEDGREWL